MKLNAEKVPGVIQRSEEWLRLRGGRVSGSRIGALLGNSRFQSRAALLEKMIAERVQPEAIEEGEKSADMQRGIDWEDAILRAGLRQQFGRSAPGMAEDTDSFWLDEKADICYSPDGVIEVSGRRWLIEVKAPRKHSAGMEIPPWHQAQVRLGMEMLRCDCTMLIEGLVVDRKVGSLVCKQTEYDPSWWQGVCPEVREFQEQLEQGVKSAMLANEQGE